MRLPQLRLPRLQLSPSFEWLASLGSRRTILYLGYTSLLFLVFLLLKFPHDLLVRRALSNFSQGPVAVDFADVNFAWIEGYQLSSMRIGPAAADGEAPYLECSRLWIRPAFGALVRGNPYDLLLHAELYGGSAQGEIRMQPGALEGTLQWKDLNLGRYRTLTALLDEGQLAGRLSGSASFESHGARLDSGQGSGEFTLEGAALTAAKISGFPVPDLHLRQTKFKFTVRGGRLEIQDFQATGDVDIQGSGNVTLREPVSESILNLRTTIQQSLATPDAIKTLVALIPRPPGAKPDAPVMISGTLGRPHVR